jgi:hypothetical protein
MRLDEFIVGRLCRTGTEICGGVSFQPIQEDEDNEGGLRVAELS